MKTNATMKKLRRTVSMIAALSGLAVATQAQMTIGDWQDYTDNGWIDWGNGKSITDPANLAPAGAYSFVDGVVPGYDTSLRVQKSGWNQDLAIKLEYTPGAVAAFLTNNQLRFTISVDGTGYSSGYDQINTIYINASGYGWHSVPSADITATGDQSGTPGNFYFWGEGFQSQIVNVNYSSILPLITATPGNGYIEIIFATNNGNNGPNYLDLNDVMLVPEPSTLALIGLGAAGLFWLRRKNS